MKVWWRAVATADPRPSRWPLRPFSALPSKAGPGACSGHASSPSSSDSEAAYARGRRGGEAMERRDQLRKRRGSESNPSPPQQLTPPICSHSRSRSPQGCGACVCACVRAVSSHSTPRAGPPPPRIGQPTSGRKIWPAEARLEGGADLRREARARPTTKKCRRVKVRDIDPTEGAGTDLSTPGVRYSVNGATMYRVAAARAPPVPQGTPTARQPLFFALVPRRSRPTPFLSCCSLTPLPPSAPPTVPQKTPPPPAWPPTSGPPRRPRPT